MPRPTITAVNILEKRREDGGADLLVQVTLGNGDVHWLAVRQGDATLTATRAVEGHGRRFITVPARRTLKAGVANLLTDWPEILRQNRVDAKGDHWELYRDDFDRRERRRRLNRELARSRTGAGRCRRPDPPTDRAPCPPVLHKHFRRQR
jgi:hypothetical protein